MFNPVVFDPAVVYVIVGIMAVLLLVAAILGINLVGWSLAFQKYFVICPFIFVRIGVG